MKTVERNLSRICRTRGAKSRTRLTRYAAAVLASAIVAVAAPAAAPTISADALKRLAQIRAEVDAPYRGLRVSGLSSTSAIDSLTLFDGVDPASHVGRQRHLLRRLPFERDAVDDRTVNDALAGYPVPTTSAQLRAVVDAATLPRLYAHFALAATPGGRDSLLAWPLGLAP